MLVFLRNVSLCELLVYWANQLKILKKDSKCIDVVDSLLAFL